MDHFWPAFYYAPVENGKNVWLLMQLACIVLFALGLALVFGDIQRSSNQLEST